MPAETDETRSLIEIDPDKLDQEWVEQPTRFYDQAVALAEARRDVATAKAMLDVTKASVAAAIRDNPDQYGLPKVTEAAVEAAVLISKEYMKAVKSHNDAKYHQDLCQAAVDSLEHRKRALESLVSLHGQNYFSTPREKAKVTREDVTAKKSKK